MKREWFSLGISVGIIIVFFLGIRALSIAFKMIFTSKIIAVRFAHLIVSSFIVILVILQQKKASLITIDLGMPSLKGMIIGGISDSSLSVVMCSIAWVVSLFVQCDAITAGNVENLDSCLTGVERFVTLASVCIITPIVEEFMIRGMLLGSLRKLYGVKLAIIGSSVLFGLLHGTSLFTILATGISGAMLATVYVTYGSLWTTVCIHAAYNFTVAGSKLLLNTSVIETESLDRGLVIALASVMIIVYGRVSYMACRRIKYDLKKLSEC